MRSTLLVSLRRLLLAALVAALPFGLAQGADATQPKAEAAPAAKGAAAKETAKETAKGAAKETKKDQSKAPAKEKAKAQDKGKEKGKEKARDDTDASGVPAIDAKAYILLDYHTGKVLAEMNADERLEPASLTKIMTAYVIFRELQKGRIKLTDKVPVSEKAWRTGGSRMFLDVNTQVTVEELLHGMVIQSGNDASVALAEYVSGTEQAFAELMNSHANRLGMKNSHFTDAPGLPDPDHYASARDMGIVAAATIREFPEYYRWYSQKDYTYNKITQPNRNLLLGRDESVDGMKTGHTEGAGFCLVASAKREQMRLISVVMGTEGTGARAKESQALLNYGFRTWETRRVQAAKDKLGDSRVWKGDREQLPVGVAEDFYASVPRGQFDKLTRSITLAPQILAPVAKGQPVGGIKLTLDGKTVAEAPVVALEEIPEGGYLRQATDAVLMMFE